MRSSSQRSLLLFLVVIEMGLGQDLDNPDKRGYVYAQVGQAFPIIAYGLYLTQGILIVADQVAKDVPSKNDASSVALILNASATGLAQPWWCAGETGVERAAFYSCALYDSYDCQILGAFTPESAMAIATMVDAFVAVTLAPPLGAFADRTSYRKALFGLFVALQAFFYFGLTFLSSSTLYLVMFLGLVSGVFGSLSNMLSQSYLPEACDTDLEVMAVSGWAVALLYATQVISLIAYTTIQVVFGLDTMDMVAATSIVASLGMLLLGLRAYSSFTHRDALHAGNVGDSRGNCCVGSFSAMRGTMKNLVKKYPTTALVLFSMCCYQAFVTTLVVLSTTYLSAELGLDSLQIGIMFLCSLCCSAPAGMLLKTVRRRYSTKAMALGTCIGWILLLGCFLLILKPTMPPPEILSAADVDLTTHVNASAFWGMKSSKCSERKNALEDLYNLTQASSIEGSVSFATAASYAAFAGRVLERANENVATTTQAAPPFLVSRFAFHSLLSLFALTFFYVEYLVHLWVRHWNFVCGRDNQPARFVHREFPAGERSGIHGPFKELAKALSVVTPAHFCCSHPSHCAFFRGAEIGRGTCVRARALSFGLHRFPRALLGK